MAHPETEVRFQEIVEMTEDVIWVRPVNTPSFSYVSPSYERITGYSVEAVYENPFAMLQSVVAGDRKAIRATFTELTSETSSLRFRYRDRHGAILWGKSRVHTVFDAAGKPLRRIGVIANITDEVEQERMLEESLVRQKEINTLKSAFVSIVSHEFRTPMSTIFSGAEVIDILAEKVRNKALSGKLSFFARQTCQEIKRLDGLIRDVSTLEKWQSGELVPQPHTFDLVECCQRTVRRIAENNGQRQRITFTSTLLQLVVHLDAGLLERCLTNLLTNALTYSALSEKTIELALAETTTGIQLSVKDYGIGIPPEELNKVGHAFFRASNTRGITGSGLGLAYVRQILTLQGGRFTIASELNKYTLCTMDLPVCQT